ncbi:MAG: hypothetical protein MAG715_01145 [Methanonatronarchaeales archaeon]|nr:hypothetical protein [Methanonatronarchaeales archaeon]
MDRKTALRTVKRELEKELDVQEVYLFGSRARGSYDEDSDYDLAVVSPDFEDTRFKERQELVRPLVRKALGDVPLDVACYTSAEFEEGKKGFLPGIIEKEGARVGS